MNTPLTVAVLLVSATLVAENQPPCDHIFQTTTEPVARSEIDNLVFDRLRELGIEPARPCSDAVFLRRVYLDCIGTLPTLEEARKFLGDRDPDKRQALIDQLLQRDQFADYWAMKWSDLLRVKAEFPINLWPNAAQGYHHWIRSAIRQNMPYDRFVRELLTANGSNFRVPQVNFYRAVQSKQPQTIAQTVALTFMGTRADKWPAQRLQGMAAFFSMISYKPTGEWKEEIVSFDPDKLPAPADKPATSADPQASSSAAAAASPPVFPDGTPATLAAGQDPRNAFADWLIAPGNPWFARNIVNRVWSWLLGRGIIHEPDDIRPDNPPSNPKLLAWLEKELVASKYDLKHIYRLILNSQTYQLSSIPRSDSPQAAANFAQYPLRRVEAEVLIDALNQITGTTEQYSSPIPEPFTFIPEGQRSITLPDGSITSSFLEQFGRPSRDTGLESERSNRPTADQRLHLLNSSHIQRKIESSPTLKALFTSAASRPANNPRKSSKAPKARQSSANPAEEAVTSLYLTILSRRPTRDETQTALKYINDSPGRREAAMDLAWALINSAEFLYRH